jgi:hypothetical protein
VQSCACPLPLSFDAEYKVEQTESVKEVRGMKNFGWLAALALLPAFSSTADSKSLKEDLEDKLQATIASAVGKAIAPLGATIVPGNVVVDPDLANTLGSPDVRIHIDVVAQDCKAVEAIARSIETVANELAKPHGVPDLRFFAIMTDIKQKGEDRMIDRRDITASDMLRLRNGRAKIGRYLGVGETTFAASVTLPARDDAMFKHCTQKLCAPDPESMCTAKQDPYVPGGGFNQRPLPR